MHRLRNEDGASAVVFALFAVVLFGMAAFALDTAAIYQERRELQNGADAAALAVAEDCLRFPASCTLGAAGGTASGYADANADDGVSQVDAVTLDVVAQQVDVKLRTEDTAGATVLAPIFGRVLGFNGASVTAKSSAVWGRAGEMKTVPLIISDCEWFDVDRPPLQPGPDFVGDPWLFVFHEGNQGRTCDHSNSGFDLPGGFGWLDADAGPCRALFQTGEWKDGVDPGSSPSATCTPAHIADAFLNKPAFLPYYEDKLQQGNNGSYLVSGLGAFWITGYNFGGQFKEPSNDPPCSGTTRCIAGYFLSTTTSEGEPGGPDRGASIVKLIP
jgi:hypothetical protein